MDCRSVFEKIKGYLRGIMMSGATRASVIHQQRDLRNGSSDNIQISTAARSAAEVLTAARSAAEGPTAAAEVFKAARSAAEGPTAAAAVFKAARSAAEGPTAEGPTAAAAVFKAARSAAEGPTAAAAEATSREVQRQGQQYSGIHQQRRSIGSSLHIAVPYCVVSIFRVPKFLKKSEKEHAYVPQTVSLGLINREVPDPMKIHKERAVNRVARRFNIDSNDFFSRAKQQILQVKDVIRNSYAEIINSETKDEIFVKNMVLDGCFILEILRTLGGDQISLNNDYEPIFETNKIDYTGLDILNDFLMLENQIPLIILQKLLELAEFNSSGNVHNMLLKVLVINPRAKFYPFIYDTEEKWSWPQSKEPVHHLLGLLHSMIVSPTHDCVSLQIDRNGFKGPTRIPCAVALKNAGIRFQHCNGGIKNIYFRDHTIHLPLICITDHTEVLFRNLMALELCKASEINYVSCYVSLMDQLIDSKEDVALLIRDEVITNYLGSDGEVAELFNGLCKGVTVSRIDYFGQLKQDVYKQYKNKFKVQFAEFANEYLSSPWRTAALTGAIFALVLAIVQTIFSILSVVL